MLYFKLYNLTLKQKQVFLCICSLQFVWFIRQFTFSVKCKSMRDICVNIWISKMDNFYSKVTRTCIKETWKMITTTQIEDLLERNWNITSLVRNHISFMNPPRRNVSSFRTNGMQAYIIQYTILMMIQCYIFYNVSYLSPSISTSVLMTQPAQWTGEVAGHHQQLAAAVMNPAKF